MSRPDPAARPTPPASSRSCSGSCRSLLILRIILLLLVANRGNDIVQFILNITQPFVDPFIGMFSLNRVTADQGSVLDVAAIVALIGVDPHRDAHPGRDPALLASDDRRRLTLALG